MPEAAEGEAQALFEQGQAFMALEGNGLQAQRRKTGGERKEPARRERFDVVVVGAGQAGLSVGYHLRRQGLNFVILEGSARIGDQWRRRWDSLRLFTPAKFDGLDGMRFPADGNGFPTKNEMADYLETYAARFGLPVRTGTAVTGLSRMGGRYVLSAGSAEYEADQVVVAAASYQQPRIPPLAAQLEPSIRQLHSYEYRNPSQLQKGGVLLVGAGNSGAEIAKELAPHHQVWMAGRDVGKIPFRIDGFLGRNLLGRLVIKGLFHRVLTMRTPVGRKARPKIIAHGGPLIRVKPKELATLGVERVGRMAGVREGKPQVEDGRVLDVRNVIWCTGFGPGLTWIDLDIFDEHGHPRHQRGVVGEAPGLYFVGLHFLYSLSSTMIHGVGRDARHVVQALLAERRATAGSERAEAT
jgi:putative flavoprotein involved in K+ transport